MDEVIIRLCQNTGDYQGWGAEWGRDKQAGTCIKAEPSGDKCDVENGEGRVINTRMAKTDKGWTALQK